MTDAGTRYLYLARHGEASADESTLTPRGRRQAALLGERLKSTPLSVIHHGPLPRTVQTAELIGERLRDVPLVSSDAAGDYLPYVPRAEELPSEIAETVLGFLGDVSEEDRRRGAELAREALAQFTGSEPQSAAQRHELVVTHGFLIGWLVRAALDAPLWRWLGVPHGNAALTVLRYSPGRPPAVLCCNDMRHLPQELRWTGFPAELHA